MRPLIATAVFCAVLMSAPGAAQNLSLDTGKREYTEKCAVCHGTTGRGDGPMATQLKRSPPDLTTLSKRNDGVFPVARMFDFIDGTHEIKAHGTREMPIWGTEYSKARSSVIERYGVRDDAKASQSFVRSRIAALINYIQSLQKK